MNWLLSAAIERNLQALQMKINNSNPEALRKALEETADFEDFTHSNAIHLIAKLFDGPGFYELIDKLPQDVLNQFIAKQNDWGMTGLHAALIFQRREEAVLLLLDKLDPRVLNECLMLQDNADVTGFMAAAFYQQQSVFPKIFNARTKDAFLKTMSLTDNNQFPQFNIMLYRVPAPTIIEILTWLDDQTLEEAISKENNARSNGLHLATVIQDDQVMKLLGERLSGKLLSELALRNDNLNRTYLHHLLGYYEKDTVFTFLQKISPNVLMTALAQLDNDRWSPFAIALTKQEEGVIQYLVNSLPNANLNQIFAVSNQAGRSCLAQLVDTQSEQIFLKVLSKLEPNTIDKLLAQSDPQNNTILKLCALRYSSQTLEQLLQYSDTNLLDRELTNPVKEEPYVGWNLLNLIVSFHDGEVLTHVVAKASEQAIDAAVNSTCRNEFNYGSNALHQIFSLNDEASLKKLLDKISDSTLNQALLVTNKNGWAPLHFMASLSSKEIMHYVIKRLTAASVDKGMTLALSQSDVRGTTVLHQLLFNQDYEVIKEFCDKASQNVLEQAFLMKLMYGDKINQGALSVMSYHSDSRVLDYFLARIPKNVMAEAILTPSTNGSTPLHYAARFLRAEVVDAFCNVLTDEQFNDIIAQPGDMLEVHNITPFQIILSSQFPHLGQLVIHRMNQRSLEKALLTRSNTGFPPITMVLTIQDYPTIKYVLDNLSDDALKMALKDTPQHYYQMLINNSVLTNETAQLLLEELRQRVGE